MKSSLRIGIKGKLSTRVGPGQTITLGGDRRATVFSTPSMINLMEHAAREALRPHLEAGEESVGVDVQIAHSSATPPKSKVTAEATVTAIEKRVISFDVVARDPWGEIGRGIHRRAVIETSRLISGLGKKFQAPASAAAIPAAMPTLNTIECQLANGLLRLTLNRPKKRNAISAETTAELERIVDWLAGKSDVRVVIVSGGGGTFCAGDDVGDLPDSPDAAQQLSVRRGAVYQRMTELPQVLIAAIDGLVLGGGFVLAAACDFRIATHRAKLGMPEVLLGWPPNYGLGIVQSILGRGRTLELTLGGETINSRRAEAIGFLNRVVSQSQLEPEATRLAEKLLAMPQAALSAAKQQLAPGQSWSDHAAADVFAECLTSDIAQKSIARFKK